MIGRDAFQESDIIGMANPVVKYAFQPRTAGEIPEVVKKDFTLQRLEDLALYLLIFQKMFKQKESMNFLMNLKFKDIILGLILILFMLKKQLTCYCMQINQ